MLWSQALVHFTGILCDRTQEMQYCEVEESFVFQNSLQTNSIKFNKMPFHIMIHGKSYVKNNFLQKHKINPIITIYLKTF